MRVATGQHPDVDADRGVERQRLEHVLGQRTGVVAADDRVHLPLGLTGVDAVRPAREVDRAMHERLVERHGRVAESPDAALVTQGRFEGLADADRGVLDRVVRVDLEVADRVHVQVEQGVLGQRVEHVVVEPNTR